MRRSSGHAGRPSRRCTRPEPAPRPEDRLASREVFSPRGRMRKRRMLARVHELRLQTRWTDFDALGHVTHAAYPVYLDEARDAYLTETVGSFAEWPCVVAHVSIDYR